MSLSSFFPLDSMKQENEMSQRIFKDVANEAKLRHLADGLSGKIFRCGPSKCFWLQYP